MGESFEMNYAAEQKEYLAKKFKFSVGNNWLQVILIAIIAIACGYLLTEDSKFQFLPLFIALIILLIIKPHLGLYAIFLSDIWFSYHEAVISRRTIILSFVVSIYMFYFLYNKKKIHIDRKVKYIVYTVFVLLLWGLITDFLINEVPLKNFYGIFAKLWLPLLIALLMYFFIENQKILNRFIYVIILGVSVSGLIGILQFFFGGVFYNIVPHPEHIAIGEGKIFGLSGIPHIYASQIASTIPLTLVIILSQHKFHKILSISFVILTIALFLTFERSALFGCAISIILLFLFVLKAKNAIKISILILVLLLLFSVLSRMSERSERLFQAEGSALGRIPLFISALYICKDNPFGVGRGQYGEEVENYLWQLNRFENYQVVTVTTPHNQFLNLLVYWGIPGFILLIIFYYQILKQINYIRIATSNRYTRTISIGLLFSFIAYIMNSMFHNNGAFTGDPFHWYMIGVAFSLIKLESRKNL